MKNMRAVTILACLCLLGASSLLGACKNVDEYPTPTNSNGGYGGAGGESGGIGGGEAGGGEGGHGGHGGH